MGSLIVEDGEEVLPTTMTPVTMGDFDEYLGKYVGSTCKLALLLDYDGTLAPIAPHPDLAIIPDETKRVSPVISASRSGLKYVVSFMNSSFFRHWSDLLTILMSTLQSSQAGMWIT